MSGDLPTFTKVVGSRTRTTKLHNAWRDGIQAAVLWVLKVPWISQRKLSSQFPRPRATVLLSFLKSILLPKYLHPLGSWHFCTACGKDGHGLAEDPLLARRMVLAATALTDHSPPSALLTCTGRAINIRNSSGFDVIIMNWNLCWLTPSQHWDVPTTLF